MLHRCFLIESKNLPARWHLPNDCLFILRAGNDAFSVRRERSCPDQTLPKHVPAQNGYFAPTGHIEQTCG